MWFILPVLLTLHVFVCALLILVVLVQRPRSEGLGAAFGGTVTDNLFGAQTTSVLGKATVWLGVGFFAITLLLAIAYARRDTGETAVQRQLLSQPVPAATATPVPAEGTVAPAVASPSPAASPVE
jgi:preprotein translocase subunit SecG